MGLITISRGTFSGSKIVSELLAKELGYKLVCREDIVKKTDLFGIPVNKLQEAITKPPVANQRLKHLREVYLAYMRLQLCEMAINDKIIYNGHSGHLLMKGVPNILKIRVLGDMEFRINGVNKNLNLDREEAKIYIKNVDTERSKWTYSLFGRDWSDPMQYDLTLNLSEVPANKAVESIIAYLDSPEFKITGETTRALENLKLESLARVQIGKNSRTEKADIKVTAEKDYVNVIIPPKQADVVQDIFEVTKELGNNITVNCTIANTSILWIQEKYHMDTGTYRDILNLAKKMDAAVEMLRWEYNPGPLERFHNPPDIYNSGESTLKPEPSFSGCTDLQSGRVIDALIREGYSGGCSTVRGSSKNLYLSILHPKRYSLFVIDDLFLSKPPEVRKRKTAELIEDLAVHFKLPVLEPSELKSRISPGKKQKFFTAGCFIVAMVLFISVFFNHGQIIKLITDEANNTGKIIIITIMMVFVPAFAYAYSTITKTILRLFKIG